MSYEGSDALGRDAPRQLIRGNKMGGRISK